MKETSASIQGKNNIPIEWLPILAYHKIGTQKELGITWIAPSVFEKQIAFLHSEQYQTVSPNDLTEALKNNKYLKSVLDKYENKIKNLINTNQEQKVMLKNIVDYLEELDSYLKNKYGRPYNLNNT